MMSAFGPKRTRASALQMSAFGGKADMTVTLILSAQAMWYHSRSAQTGGPNPRHVEVVDV